MSGANGNLGKCFTWMWEQIKERNHASANNQRLGNCSIANGVFIACGAMGNQVNASNGA
jgi:hypothetical protein